MDDNTTPGIDDHPGIQILRGLVSSPEFPQSQFFREFVRRIGQAAVEAVDTNPVFRATVNRVVEAARAELQSNPAPNVSPAAASGSAAPSSSGYSKPHAWNCPNDDCGWINDSRLGSCCKCSCVRPKPSHFNARYRKPGNRGGGRGRGSGYQPY